MLHRRMSLLELKQIFWRYLIEEGKWNIDNLNSYLPKLKKPTGTYTVWKIILDSPDSWPTYK